MNKIITEVLRNQFDSAYHTAHILIKFVQKIKGGGY